MNWFFAATGSKREVLGQLKNAETRGSELAAKIRDTIQEAVENDPEPQVPGTREFYDIQAHGHTGDAQTPFNLSIQIRSRYLPRTDSALLWPFRLQHCLPVTHPPVGGPGLGAVLAGSRLGSSLSFAVKRPRSRAT